MYLNLVFKEYINFLKAKGVDVNKYNLQEGYYWLDNQIIKCYDIDGNIHKILRLHIDDNLNITITDYKNKKFEIESWKQTIKRKQQHLRELEMDSLKLIRKNMYWGSQHDFKILSSGGKDSSVVTYLVRQVNKDVQIIFNNTTLDCADTYLHMKSLDNVYTINPKEGFYQWRERLNFVPTRFARSCCNEFKEGAMIKDLPKENKYLFFMGMRNEESNTRSSYDDEWVNEKWEGRDWLAILPIRKWAEEDVWLYILWRNVEYNPKYHKGYSRCGCNVACPFYSKSTWVLDKYWYPKAYERWQNILEEDFVKNNKDLIMNCTLDEYKLKAWNGGTFRDEPTEKVIEEFANRNELDVNVAEKYFNHYCVECDKAFNEGESKKRKKIKSKEVLGMNLKLLGRNTEEFYCKKHLIDKISYIRNKDYTKEDWNNDVERFKDQGCTLF